MMLRSDAVSSFLSGSVFFFEWKKQGKLLQAVCALNQASAMNAEDPELHVRLVDVRLRTAEVKGPDVFVESVNRLIPESVSLERFNCEYYERHRREGGAVIGVARVLKMLGLSVEEVIFGMLDDMKIEDGKRFMEMVSYRDEEFKDECEKRFPHSTVFKRREEIIELKRRVSSLLLFGPEC